MGTGPCRSGNLFKSHFLRGGKPLKYIPPGRGPRAAEGARCAPLLTTPSTARSAAPM